ncbi:MAG TPA: YjjG family noncanonical pyrimidine nucleotidase [Lacibacter sp.]|nr:YjjG family noncanonical pyrimidine nucleotidase [Lacibacter sp.]HMO88604.1 YjjG family noncanonical pyrimidine nucleotidase [Lacibacter sp.]HMP85966.1 YjjG family noncanonical pyrimidine nucleotidase [Lacibacter sp.]
MKYRHLFFDLDHTLWDFDANAVETLADVYRNLELPGQGVDDFDLFCKHYLHHNAVLWDRYHHGYITSEELKWKRMWRTLLEFRIGSEPLARKMSDHFLEILPTKRNLFPYTHEILQHLKEKGYVLHLITNGFEKTQWRKLTNSNLGHYFEEVITSEGSNSVKPNREIFEYALRVTGAVLPESIMIGDNLDADIKGALQAGMDAVFVNHLGITTDVSPTYTVHHLQELETIF